jgi:hypothetical protein
MAVATGSKAVILVRKAYLKPSTVTYLFRTTGQVLGVSLSGTIFQAVLVTRLRETMPGPNAAEVWCFRERPFLLLNILQTIEAIR